jgi:hypothetical protein
MKRVSALAAFALVAACSNVCADYTFVNTGTWPMTWPKELEPLRKQSRTLEGPLAPDQHYAIRFTSREEFEAAWPHLLKVKSKGTSLVLVRGPNFFLGEHANAGVVIHSPADDRAAAPANPKAPGVGRAARRGLNATHIELVVDGAIVDLNCIPLPADTPIIDKRFNGK